MKKRIVGTLMALLLAATVLPPGAISVTSADVTTGLVTTAYAAGEHKHCLCATEDGTHKGECNAENVTWKPYSDGITSGTKDKPNYYYLTSNIGTKNGWNLSTQYEYIVICLNGYNITSEYGQTIHIMSGVNFTITDCKPTGQQGKITHTEGNGKGVYVNHSTFNMYGGSISGNTEEASNGNGGRGGGVRVDGTFNMYGGTITGNTTKDGTNNGGQGGGVYVDSGATFNMTGGTIGGTDAAGANKASSGGGVYVAQNAKFNMTNGTISGNTAGKNGGGVYVGEGTTFNMTGGTIGGNKVEATGGFDGNGGGVYVQDGTFNMDGGLISGNAASESNYADGGGVFVIGNFTMSDGTISGNKAYRGAGVQVGDYYPNGSLGSGTFTMTGGIIGGTTADAANIATYGGGVNVWSTGTFDLRSGSIIGNEANGTVDENGGGVHSNGTFNVSGDPIVKSNTREIQGSTYADNVDSSDKAINVVGVLRDAVEIVVNRTSKTKITGVATYYSAIPNDDGSVTLRAPTGSSGGETGGETAEHKHCVCGTGTLGHTHDANVTWIGVAALSEITTAGNYYLKKDITLENTWNVPTAGVVLCLNGKTVTAKQTGIIVPANSTLTLTDCKPDGKGGCISGNKWRGIEINGGGSLTIYAGKIEKFNTGLDLSEGGTLTMYGGTIADNLASGVAVQDGGNAVISGGTVTGNSTGVTLGGTLTVDGNAVITGNSYAGIDDYGTLTIGGNANITENGGSWGKINVNLASLEGKEPVPITVRNDFNGEFGLTTSLQDGTKVINGTVKGTITCDSSRKTIDADGKIWKATSVPVEGVVLNKQELSLTKGDAETLIARVMPATATNKNVTWHSSDTSVATVVDGAVTAVSAGTTTITVTTEDGGKAACCIVTVTEAQPGHVHVKGERTYDENGHWFKCTGCNEKLEYAVHQLNADGKCECGYVKQGDTPTPTPTPEAPRYYYSSGSGSTGAGGLSAVQNDPNGKSATDYSGGIYGLLFRTNAALSAFRGVQVDGVTIDAANYSVEGNEVYLKAVYLQTLANGKHTLTVLSGEGDATAQFTVGGVVSAPKTADAGALAYLGLALSSYVGTALVTRRKKEF